MAKSPSPQPGRAARPARPVSEKRLAANRANAQKSTGPRTAAGKGRSRFNAVKHGLTASVGLLPGENGMALHDLSAAVHAYLAAGAPSSDDLMLLVCEHDVMGQPLTGEHNYRIHFEPGAAPPADAYWALHARPAPSYGNRHGLGSRDELVASADGSLDLALQRQSPSRRLTANWLICPASRFALTMRVYSPWPAAVQGAWRMPAVERVDDQVEATRSGSVRRHRPPQIPTTDSRRKSDALAMIWRPSV